MTDTILRGPTPPVPAGTPATPGSEPSEGAFAHLSDARLEADLAAHAANLAAAECRFSLMVEEVDRRGFWAAQGAKSCAHWLSWRCGTSPVAAREHVRVGRAPRRLPLLCEAFSSGKLSYSKVRAITRIATASSEALLVEWAAYATAAQLETIVRGFRRASPEEGRQAVEKRRHRAVHHRTDHDGMVVIEARLCPEDAASVLAAIEATRATLATEKSRPRRTKPEGATFPRERSAKRTDGKRRPSQGRSRPPRQTPSSPSARRPLRRASSSPRPTARTQPSSSTSTKRCSKTQEPRVVRTSKGWASSPHTPSSASPATAQGAPFGSEATGPVSLRERPDRPPFPCAGRSSPVTRGAGSRAAGGAATSTSTT